MVFFLEIRFAFGRSDEKENCTHGVCFEFSLHQLLLYFHSRFKGIYFLSFFENWPLGISILFSLKNIQFYLFLLCIGFKFRIVKRYKSFVCLKLFHKFTLHNNIRKVLCVFNACTYTHVCISLWSVYHTNRVTVLTNICTNILLL